MKEREREREGESMTKDMDAGYDSGNFPIRMEGTYDQE